jgi:excisionase family DNA binding protein
MPNSATPSGRDLPDMEVLTLPEVAAYLRVPEEGVLALVESDALPAQRVGGEWRFLKRAVVEWLRFGPHFHHESGPRQSTAKPGSKEAVLRHFGIFQGDADLDEQLALSVPTGKRRDRRSVRLTSSKSWMGT